MKLPLSLDLAQKWAAGLSVMAFVVTLVGLRCPAMGCPDWIGEYSANISSELFGIAIAVFVIDLAGKREAERRRIRDLVAQAGSPSNDFALEAIRLLRLVRQKDGTDMVEAGALAGADLTRADLTGADLAGADLSGANLTGVSLGWVSLAGADLAGADLTRARLRRIDLGGGISSSWVSLTGANLTGADLTEADLEGAKGLTQAQLCSTKSYKNAQNLPDGLLPDTRQKETR